MTDPNKPPQPGDKKFSPFFGSYIMLVHYTSDRDFIFSVINNPKWPDTYKNQSPWSSLPNHP